MTGAAGRLRAACLLRQNRLGPQAARLVDSLAEVPPGATWRVWGHCGWSLCGCSQDYFNIFGWC